MNDDAFVRFVQEALRERGLLKTVDGRAGDKTVEAFVKAIGPAPVPTVAPSTAALGEGFDWDERSERNLQGVHEDLVAVITRARAISRVPFIVIEGLRSVERQRQLVKQGASKTMNSRHLTGHAIDFVPLGPNGQPAFDWPLYHKIGPIIEQVAKEMSTPITWGARWASFPDGPHVELQRSAYP